jgi:16S rRNA (guanine527-N7)-methyltransferase
VTDGLRRAGSAVGAPAPPEVAAEIFGNRLPLVQEYADRLADEGVVRGLIGPREVPRLWERHILNCAVLTDLLPKGAGLVDVGSGAGLPGIVLALRRPDLTVTLLEPMQRRVAFLTETVEALRIGDMVEVVRGRAEDPEVRRHLLGRDWVVARAVAPLDRLVEWCLPLVAPGGRLLALKGAKAADEVAEHEQALRRAGAGRTTVHVVGQDLLAEPTWVVDVERAAPVVARGQRKGSR